MNTTGGIAAKKTLAPLAFQDRDQLVNVVFVFRHWTDLRPTVVRQPFCYFHPRTHILAVAAATALKQNDLVWHDVLVSLKYFPATPTYRVASRGF